MKRLLFAGIVLLSAFNTYAQYTFKANIRKYEENVPLAGATVTWKEYNRSAAADSTGLVVINNIPAGLQTFNISFVGHQEKIVTYTFPLPSNTIINIYLEEEEPGSENEVLVTSTRTSRSIMAIPTRIEVITGEELDEKSNMAPANITMLLRESTGIQVQQTSAVSGNSSFRLQGLPGRYTQLLKDGFPLYSGYSGGLSLLQVPPLDLRQVEVIKGSASTLYGGGAIAGLVNLISKQPQKVRETQFFLNGTSAGGFDANAFYSQQLNKLGLQLYTTYNVQSAFDPAGAGFSALPQQKKFNFNPKFFYNPSSKNKIMIAVNFSNDDRTGGSIGYIKNKANAQNEYFERNRSNRFSTQLHWQTKLNETDQLTIKNSINVFTNKLTQPNYFFGGRQSGSYTEIAYNINRKKNNWVIGSNIWTDAFTEERPLPVNIRDYHLFTAGGFIQNNFTVTDHIIIETGLRADLNQLKNSYHNSKNYTFLLPRLSALFVLNNHYSARLTGGLGYKMPAIFNEEAEMASYKNVRTINADKVKPELSEGISADLYYKARVGKVSINFNQLFFYTIVKKPLIFDRALAMQSIYEYINAPSLMDTKGFESQVKMRWKELVFFGGYTFQETRRKYLANTPLPFAPKHRLLMTLMYDKEEHVKMGFESSYTGSQHLTDGRIVRSYWTAGFSAEKIWKHFSLYVNFENFTNTRQTKWEPFYTGSAITPVFTEVYAPIDGFIFNGGIKIRL